MTAKIIYHAQDHPIQSLGIVPRCLNKYSMGSTWIPSKKTSESKEK